jgi:hypothetical protein
VRSAGVDKTTSSSDVQDEFMLTAQAFGQDGTLLVDVLLHTQDTSR